MRLYILIIQMVIPLLLVGCKISGSVKNIDRPMKGVTLTLSGEDIERTVLTDENGNFVFEDIPAGEYSIVPSKEGVIFYPSEYPVIYAFKDITRVDFVKFDTAFTSIALMSVPGTEYVQTGKELKIMAVGIMTSGAERIVSEFLTWQTNDEEICTVKEYSRLTKLAVGNQPGTVTVSAVTNAHYAEMKLEVRDDFFKEDDFFIENFPPPETVPTYINGCCIDSCIWAIVNANGMEMTIEEITAQGSLHLPGWGLSSLEIVTVLEKLGVPHTYLTPSNSAQTYEDILRKHVIEKIKEGIPVMFGLKYLPYQAAYLPMDHFVLAVGYNERTDEIIYNDINQINRSVVTKLVDGSLGYSVINEYDFIAIIQFPDEFM